MEISKESVTREIIECIATYKEGSEEVQISERTNPILDLGLESIDGIAFACDLSQRLKWEIPSKINPFIDDNAGSTRDVGQIADYIIQLIRKEGPKS